MNPLSQRLIKNQDIRHLERALDLAELGRGKTSPNPIVGAVIVKDAAVIGEGYHTHYGDLHAERAALNAVEGDPAGSTLYVSLEPCCHEGRQPPCTDAILEAGIARVVVASDDPTEKASGRGLGILRDEGVEVVVVHGDIAARARLANQPFRKLVKTGKPFVLFKSAMTLDGKVATSTGDSQWISSLGSRAMAHQWRAECDAIAVGIGTALSDDPQLTARLIDDPDARQPKRVIFDSEARLPLDGALVGSARDVPLIVVASRAAPREAMTRLEASGVQLVIAQGENEAARVSSALTELGSIGIQSLLLEGGPHLAGAFFDAEEVDELRLFLAPLVLGGRSARAVVEGAGVEKISDAMTALALDVSHPGADLLITARLREW